MKDLTNPKWIKAKGILFLALGLAASGLLIAEVAGEIRLRIILLLAVAAWSFCRFYYFAFYVIEKYVDPSQKFSGLFACFRYLIRNRKG